MSNSERAGPQGRKGFSRRGFLESAIAAAGAVMAGGPALAAAETVTGNIILAQAKPLAGKTIRYQQRDAGAEDFVRKIFAPQFQEQTGCKVVLEDIPQAELYAKFQIMAAAGQAGDLVFGFDNPQLPSWGSKGVLRPLDDFIKADKFDMSQFYPAVKTAVTSDGKIYGLPTAGHPGCVNLFFNKTMMKEAGVTPPDAKYPEDAWTWDTILEAAKALTKDRNGDQRPDTFGFMPSKFNANWAYVHTRQFGGDVLSEDGKKATIGNEKSKAAYRYLQDLTWKHKVAPTPADIPPLQGTEKTAGSNFATGQLAMWEDATILITTMGQYVKNFEWGVFPVPKGPGGSRGGTLFMNCTMITSSSKEPEAAWQFLKLITSKEAGVRKLLTNSGSPGMRPDVFKDAEVNKAFPWFLVGNKVMEEAKPAYKAANLRAAEVTNAILQAEGNIWLNNVPAEKGAEDLQKQIQQILDEPA